MKTTSRRFGRVGLVALLVLGATGLGLAVGRGAARPLAGKLDRSKVETFKWSKRFTICLTKPEVDGKPVPFGNVTNVRCRYRQAGTDGSEWTYKKMKLDKSKIVLTLVFDTVKPKKRDTPNKVEDEGDSGTVQISLDDDDVPDETEEIPVEEIDVDPCG